jgi:ribose transport system substrate-binding protein
MTLLRGFAVVLVVGLSLTLAACGDDDDDDGGGGGGEGTSTEAAEQPTNIAFLANAFISDYIKAKERGMKAAVEPGGGSVKTFAGNFDPSLQLKQCQDAVASQRYNAIVVAGVDGPATIPCVEAARQAEIPVVTVDVAVGEDSNDIEPQVDGVVGTVTQPPETLGQRAAELTKMACEGIDPCEIIAEVATPTDEPSNVAVDIVAETVPNAKIVQKVTGEYDPGVIAKVFPDALSAHPEADVFLAAADSQALAVVPALKNAGRFGEVLLLGQSGTYAGADAVKEGVMFGTIGQWPESEGRKAGELAIAAVNGKPIEPKGYNNLELSEPFIVTKDTVAEFKPEWGAGG